MIRGYAIFLGLIALILLGGGGWLLMLGGSPYYVLAGMLIGASAVLLWRRRRLGAWLYALFFIVTICWALWESGADGWALLPRIAGPLIVGLWLLLPAVRRQLDGSVPDTRITGFGALAAGLAIAILAGFGLHALTPHQPDPISQAGVSSPPDRPLGAMAGSGADWIAYGGDSGGSRHSSLDQLNPATIGRLDVAWTARIGAPPGSYNFEVTPIKVGDTVYACTPNNNVIALDAETGRQRWRFDAHVDLRGLSYSIACRGVAYFRVSNATGACAERILTNTIDARLIAIDARTGTPCRDFGVNGQVSLLTGMGQVTKGYYYVSSAPTIVRGKVILGGWVSDSQYWGEPSGVIRAFDATSGRFAWAFDMGRPDRHTEPPPGESYTRSTPNSWAPMSADETLGLVYAPTGNATPDYFGGQRRPFDDHYSSSVVAIDAETGAVRWSFQTTRHDLWDYDVPSQPTLADIAGPHGIEHILVQPTKRGELFLLDRITGRPLSPVNDHPAPQNGAPGERLAATQPFADGMPSLRGPDLTEAMMWGLTPIDQLWCRIQFRESRYDGPLTPPGLGRFNIVYPGYAGGSNWGGVTIDADRGMLVANGLRMANRVKLITRAEANRIGVFPLTVETGKTGVGGAVPQRYTPYGARVAPFLSPLGMPCQQPPYGTLSGIDLVTQKLVWTERLGTARDSGPFHIASMLPIRMGVPNFGGAITTRGGLTFIGATQDRYIRAYETATGRLLWQKRLPAGGQATPITYRSTVSGRQFVVIAAGGSMAIGSKAGDYLIAYALPKSAPR